MPRKRATSNDAPVRKRAPAKPAAAPEPEDPAPEVKEPAPAVPEVVQNQPADVKASVKKAARAAWADQGKPL